MDAPLQTFTYNGQTVTARRGESLAAALTAAGIRTFRTTAKGAERGIFCGMGVCQDCLVEVDGKPNQRACMTKVNGPLVVSQEAHARPLPPAEANPSPRQAPAVERPDVLIIGAGPAGIAAAIEARRAGASVIVADERAKAGGQYYKQLDVKGSDVAPPDPQHAKGAQLIAEAVALGVEFRHDITIWGAFEGRQYAGSGPSGAVRFEPRAAIIATGAYERPWPVPGWTLPGVMTTGAAQTLWRTARRIPGKRVLIAGNGPLNLQLAAELVSGGCEVVAIAEAAASPSILEAGSLAQMLLSAPDLIRDGLAYQKVARKAGVGMHYKTVVRKIEQEGQALRVTLGPAVAKAGTASEETNYTVDAVCLGYGFEPANELLRGMGVDHAFDPVRRQLVTIRDDGGRTSLPGVYAAGDCTGLGGAKAALAEGAIVGAAAAADLGFGVDPLHLAASRRNLARHRRFQKALWSLYKFGGFDSGLIDSETLICRCEEVKFGDIEDALATDMRMIGAVKRQTRVGMGRCQGRYCGPVLDTLLAGRFGYERHDLSGFAPRVPVRPVAIADLAAEMPS